MTNFVDVGRTFWHHRNLGKVFNCPWRKNQLNNLFTTSFLRLALNETHSTFLSRLTPKGIHLFLHLPKGWWKKWIGYWKRKKKKLNVNNCIPVFPSICKSFGIIGLIFQLLELNWSTKKVKKTKKQLGRKIFVARGYIFIFLIPFQVGGNLFRPHSATLQPRYHHVTHSR